MMEDKHARRTTTTEEADPQAELMVREDEDAFRARWMEIQAGFVDEPHRAVRQADELVAEVTNRISELFAFERSQLEEQWGRLPGVLRSPARYGSLTVRRPRSSSR